MYTETPWSGEGCAVPNCIISSSPEITKSFTVLPTTDPSCDLIPFPVSLFDFTAQKQGRGSVALAWQTASEQNTSYFLVERSTDGSRYTPLGKVDAAGNSSSKQSYSFLDDKTDSRMARYYYRLKMVDADGTFEYSPVRTILMKEKGASVEVRPNPSNGNVQVLLSNFANKVDLRVANLMGQTVYQTQLDADNYSSDLDLSNLPQGVYFVQATDGVASDVRKVVIEQ